MTDTRLSKLPVRNDSASDTPLSLTAGSSSPKPNSAATAATAALSNYFGAPTMVGLFGAANGGANAFGSLNQSVNQSLLGNQSINSDDQLMDTLTPDGIDDSSEMNFSLVDASMKRLVNRLTD